MTAQNRRRHDPLKARNASGINLAINRIEQWQLLSDLVALRGLRKKSLWRTPPAPSTWLEFLWRGCMKISDSEITGIQMKKINISPAQSGLLSHSPSWTIRWSHVNYDKWRSGGMCVLRQAFFFPFSCGGLSQMWCVISHQHQSRRVFTVSVITVDLIRGCIHRTNQPHAWPESLTRGWTNTREGKSTEKKTTFPISWSKPFLGG